MVDAAINRATQLAAAVVHEAVMHEALMHEAVMKDLKDLSEVHGVKELREAVTKELVERFEDAAFLPSVSGGEREESDELADDGACELEPAAEPGPWTLLDLSSRVKGAGEEIILFVRLLEKQPGSRHYFIRSTQPQRVSSEDSYDSLMRSRLGDSTTHTVYEVRNYNKSWGAQMGDAVTDPGELAAEGTPFLMAPMSTFIDIIYVSEATMQGLNKVAVPALKPVAAAIFGSATQRLRRARSCSCRSHVLVIRCARMTGSSTKVRDRWAEAKLGFPFDDGVHKDSKYSKREKNNAKGLGYTALLKLSELLVSLRY